MPRHPESPRPPVVVVETIPNSAWQHLLSATTVQDCWEFVRNIRLAAGMPCPDLFRGESSEWVEVKRGFQQPGDILFFSNEHVGIFLSNSVVLHQARQGIQTERYAAIKRARPSHRIMRPAGAITVPPAPRQGHAAFVYLRDTATPIQQRVVSELPCDGSKSLAEYAAALGIGPRYQAASAAGIVPRSLFQERCPQAGETWVFLIPPRGTEWIIPLVIGIVFSAAGGLLNYAMMPEDEPAEEAEIPSPAWDISGLRNTASPYLQIPLIYGEHRVAGNVLSSFWRAGPEDRAILYHMICLGAGPIEGIGGITQEVDLLRGSAIPTEIEIDGNPAASYYGTAVSIRLGTVDQTSIPEFSESVLSTQVGVQLDTSVQVTRTTSSSVESFEINLEFPRGLYDPSSSGSIRAKTVDIIARWRKKGTTQWTTFNWSIRRARTAAFVVTHRVSVATDPGIYEIMLERTTAFPDPGQQQSQSNWATINEITGDEVDYTGLAIVALRIEATDQLNGAVPNITQKVRGRKVWVWDRNTSTWSYEWSRNPAWICLDFILHPVDGLARTSKFSLSNVDLDGFADWSDFSAETPDINGEPSTEPRALCDVVIGEGEDPWAVLHAIARSSWVDLMLVGKKITPILDRPSSPVAIYNAGNLKAFDISFDALSLRENVVEVEYLNAETDYEADTAPQRDTYALHTLNEPMRSSTFRAVGITRASQAYRYAKWKLNKGRLSLSRVAFTAGLDAVHLLPGDVFVLAHDAVSWALGGRVKEATSTTVCLDQDIVVSVGDAIRVRTDGTGIDVLQERTLTAGTYPAGSPITVTSPWNGGDIPAAGAPWIAGPATKVERLYRITSTKLTNNLEKNIEAEEYHDEIYDDDPGPIEEFTDRLPNSSDLPGPVSSPGYFLSGVRGADGSVLCIARLSWRKDRGWNRTEVWYRSAADGTTADDDELAWQYAGTAVGENFDLGPLSHGEIYEVSLLAVSPRGAKLHPSRGILLTIAALRIRPRPTLPTESHAVVSSDRVTIYLPTSSEPGFSGYELRSGRTWLGALLLGRFPSGMHSIPLAHLGSRTIRIRAISTEGQYSSGEEVFSLDAEALPGSVADLSQNEKTNVWSGTKTFTEVVPAGPLDGGPDWLALDADSSLTGSYTSPAHALSALLDVEVLPTASVGLLDQSPTWDEMNIPWDECEETWDDAVLDPSRWKERLTWDEMAFEWDSLGGSAYSWDGLRNLDEALEPTFELRHSSNSGSSWSDWAAALPQRVTANRIQTRILLQTIHERLVPVVHEMAVDAFEPGAEYVVVDPGSSERNIIKPTDDWVPLQIEGALASGDQTKKLLRVLSDTAGTKELYVSPACKLFARGADMQSQGITNAGAISDATSLTGPSLTAITYSGSGTLTISSSSGTVTISSGAALNLTGTSAAAVNITAGAAIVLNPASGSTVQLGKRLVFTDTLNDDQNRVAAASGRPLSLQGRQADSATADTVIINCGTALSSQGSALLSLRNNGTEKALFNHEGGLEILGPSARPSIVIPHQSTPTQNIVRGAVHLEDDEALGHWWYSTDKGDWLGTEWIVVDTAFNQNAVTTANYLRGGPDNQSTEFRNLVFLYDVKLTHVAYFIAGTISGAGCDILIRRNFSTVITINVTAATTYPTGTVVEQNDDTWNKGDMLQVRVDPTPGGCSINTPRVTLYFRRRK